MQTGSLINSLMNNSKNPAPVVGMGATMLGWTDRHAATIVEVSKSGRRVVIQRDKAIRTDSYGMSDCQSYSFERDENAPRRAYTLRKNGAWVAEGTSMRSGSRISIGHRSEYYDYSF